MQIGQESYRRLGGAQGSKVLEEAGNGQTKLATCLYVVRSGSGPDLHPGVGQQHAGMPSELPLLLDEEDLLRRMILITGACN